MDLTHFLEHPIFKPYQKRLKAGEYLFKQGTLGDTMFIVLEGKIRVISETNSDQFCIAMMGTGEFLGERALVHIDPYQRRFSAQAATQVMVMELRHHDILQIEKQAPYIKKMILTRSLEVAEERLDRANSLVSVLRPKECRLRMLKLIEYFCFSMGTHEKSGIRLQRLAENIVFYVQTSPSEIQNILKELADRNLLFAEADGSHLVTSLENLAKHIKSLEEVRVELAQAA